MASEPTHGYTASGLAVHAKTLDHHRMESAYQRFNKKAALVITNSVGTMTCTWLFCVLALLSLPAVLSAFSAFSGWFPEWMIRASIIALVAWVAQTFIQLVLLPTIIVGQNLQNEASDVRAAKTFEDVERVLDRLDTRTQGGITEILEAVHALDAK